MSLPYTSVAVSGHNTNPPIDDGSVTEANRVKWSTVKTKLSDPLKTAIEAINTELLASFAQMVGGGGVTSTAISYSVVSGDQGKLVVGTAAAITITTPDATSVGSPFVFAVLNRSAGDITLDGSGSQTINGSATLTMGPGDGWIVWTDGSNWFVLGRKTGVLGRGYLDGCGLSNGTDTTNDINIAAGGCRDSTNAVDITVAAMTGKQLDANWAPGASAGMRNSAAGIANGTYHIYAVATAAGVQDIYAYAGVAGTDPDSSASIATVITALQAESGGSSYIYARRLGSIVRASAAILAFTQRGDDFDISSPALDITSTNQGTSAVTHTLATVPVGLAIEAKLNCSMVPATTGSVVVYISALTATDLAPATATAPLATFNTITNATDQRTFQTRVFTNTSAQIRSRWSASGAADVLRIAPTGWRDTRGRNA